MLAREPSSVAIETRSPMAFAPSDRSLNGSSTRYPQSFTVFRTGGAVLSGKLDGHAIGQFGAERGETGVETERGFDQSAGPAAIAPDDQVERLAFTGDHGRH